MPNLLLKIYSRPSSWCLRLNKLCLKPTNHIFLKPLDLPVFGVKPPFTFSLSSKSQSLLTTFSFPSSLKLFPPFSLAEHFFIPYLPSTLFSLAPLYHLCTEGVVTSWLHSPTLPQLTTEAILLRHYLEPLPPRKHWEMSYLFQSFKPNMRDSLSPGPNLPFNPYILLLCNTSLKPSLTDILTVLQFHLVLPVSILWQNLLCLSFSPNNYHHLLKLSQPGS